MKGCAWKAAPHEPLPFTSCLLTTQLNHPLLASTHPPTAPQDALAHGQPVDGIPLHTCACPPCFTAVEKGGSVTCVPKCDLQYCDLDVGVCHAAPGTGARKRGRDVEG